MGQTNYDEVSREMNKSANRRMYSYLLRKSEEQVKFVRFRDSVLFKPGTKTRIVDAIAHLLDLEKKGLPVANFTEFQTYPDPFMPGRLMLAGGLLMTEEKPADLPGDRYALSALVVNLTGVGDSEHSSELAEGFWKIKPVERNLQEYDAEAALTDIEEKRAPAEVFAWISLMKEGNKESTRKRWLELVLRETDLRKRGQYALVAMFAELTNCRPEWQAFLKGMDMIESPYVKERFDQGRQLGFDEGKKETLVGFLKARFSPVPDEVLTHVRETRDEPRLNQLIIDAAQANDLADFRARSGF